jgi:hypothetical protein
MRKITCSTEPRGSPRTIGRSSAQHGNVGSEHANFAKFIDFGSQPRGRDRDHLVAARGERGQQRTQMP